MSRVLVFSATAGYRHDSIPAGAAALAEIAAPHGLRAVHTEDSGELAAALLDGAGCAAVVFLSPTGDVLDDRTRGLLRDYVSDGGGFLGVHAAACAEEQWPYYERLVGARFDGHPEIQPAEVTVEDRTHPATAHLPERWAWTDEWYNFRADPRKGGAGSDVRVLASVDERGYAGGTMGAAHPLVWCQRVGAGRSFYTALGHREAAYADRDFRAHLRGALLWCAAMAGS
jgi:type 1 glutamine amidotransferase